MPDEDDDGYDPGPVEAPDRPGEYDEVTRLPPHRHIENIYGKHKTQKRRYCKKIQHKRL